MKIDGSNPYFLPDFQNVKREAALPPPGSSSLDIKSPRDRLELSVTGRELNELTYKVSESSEARAERIAEIRSRIETGTYNIKAEEVAEAIITGGLIDRSA
jgi:flagellar biosynthesis anti-sigma factor FlgM